MEELKPGFRAACTFMQYGASGGHHEGTLLVFVDSDRPAVVLMPRPGSVVPPVKIDASSITGVLVSDKRPALMIGLPKGRRYLIEFPGSDIPAAVTTRNEADKQISLARSAGSKRAAVVLASPTPAKQHGVAGMMMPVKSEASVKAEKPPQSTALKGHRNRPGGQVIPARQAVSSTPRAPPSPTRDPALRQALLDNNAEIAELYRQVVETGAITAEEFWQQRRTALLNEKAKQPDVGFATANVDEGDMLKRSETQSKITFELDRWTIQKIFRESPAIFEAYLELVPQTYSEEEFWKRYFRSTYFHRGQGARGPQAKTLEGAKREAIDAVFKKFEPAPQQFKADRARLVKKVVDKSVDLVATASDRLRWREVGEHGYGTTEMASAYEPEPLTDGQVAALPASSRRGIMLARPRKKQQHVDTTSTIMQTNRFSEAVVKRAEPGTADMAASAPPPSLPPSATAVAELPDLEEDGPAPFIPLVLKNRLKYFEHGGDGEGDIGELDASSGSLSQQALHIAAELESLAHAQSLPPTNAVASVQTLVRSTKRLVQQDSSLAHGIGHVAQPAGLEALADAHRVNTELLRHFWSALTTIGSRHRAQSILATLKRKLAELVEQQRTLATSDSSSIRMQILSSLLHPLQKAIDKYNELKKKQEARKAAMRKRKAAAATAAAAAATAATPPPAKKPRMGT